MRVKECMCKNLISVTPDTTLKDVAKLMEENKIGSIVVCDKEGRCEGFLTDRDIVLRGVSCGKDCSCTKVSDVMTTNVIKTTADTDVRYACEVMAKNQVKRLPVIENGKVIGVLTLGDIANNNEISTENFGETASQIMDNKIKKNDD